jgi:hypothetical protein
MLDMNGFMSLISIESRSRVGVAGVESGRRSLGAGTNDVSQADDESIDASSKISTCHVLPHLHPSRVVLDLACLIGRSSIAVERKISFSVFYFLRP